MCHYFLNGVLGIENFSFDENLSIFHVSWFFCDFSNPYLFKLRSQQSLFSTRNILNLGFTRRPIIKFEIILMIYLRKRLRFIIFHMDIQLFQHNLLEKRCLHKLTWHVCLKSIDHIRVHLFMYSFFCSINLYVIFIPIPHCLYCISYNIYPKIEKYVLQFSFKIILIILASLHFQAILETACQFLYQKGCWDSNWDCG